MTGARIGEALGLHREDMHLLTDSHVLGCSVAGPHLHVRRRADNTNGALAKSRFPRSIPVPEEAVTLYADYAHERHLRLGDEENPLVFVNCYRPPLGTAMSYRTRRRCSTASPMRVDRGAAPSVAPHRSHDLASPGHAPRHGAGAARPREPHLDAALPAPERTGQARGHRAGAAWARRR